MSSITKSIQNEYVLLMENAFSEKYKYAFRKQGKTPDQMQDAANNFSKHLINVVEEYGKSHESAIKNSKKKKISSGLIFAGTATLGIASLAMPQLTLLSAAATGIGLAFGGKSLADIFSEHKAHKNEIQMLEKTPVSLLYGAYKKK